MESHKPKPVHTWREFAKEIGTIVIGVLIALAAGQGVEALHRRHEVHEARLALDAELSWNLMALEFRSEQIPCVNRRLNELEQWSSGWAAGVPKPLSGAIGAPVGIGYRSSIWRALADVVAKMPLEERLTYAQTYDNLENARYNREREGEAWQALAEYRQGGAATPERRGRLEAEMKMARRLNDATAADQPIYTAPLLKLGIKPSPRPLAGAMTGYLRSFCSPMLGG